MSTGDKQPNFSIGESPLDYQRAVAETAYAGGFPSVVPQHVVAWRSIAQVKDFRDVVSYYDESLVGRVLRAAFADSEKQ